MSRTVRAVAVAVLGGILVATAFSFPVSHWILSLVGWIRQAGPAGMAAYGGIYILATVLMIPGSLLTLGAGFAYGPLLGTLLVSPSSVLGASLAFLAGRSLARDWVLRKVSGDRRFAAIDEAVGRKGFFIVLLLRLSPVFPYVLLNYALGLTRVRLREYAAASFLGMLPATILFVYLGSLITNAGELVGGRRPGSGPWEQALYWGGLAATVIAVSFIVRLARRSLHQALKNATAPGAVKESEVQP